MNKRRRTIFIAVLSVSVLVSMLWWMLRSGADLDVKEWIMIMIQLAVVIFAIAFAFNRLRSVKHNLPAEDEMSRNIKQRGAATAYYASMYMWLAIMLFEEYIPLEGHTLIGGGILGMALIFVLSCLYHKNFRTSND